MFLIGYCEVCKKATKFNFKKRLLTPENLNFRGNFHCQHCGLGNRKRFLLSYLEKTLKDSEPDSTVYLYEQATSWFTHAKIFKDINLIGSEFMGYDKKSGEIINGFRHEDATNLSFENESIDIIASNDVYEHVQDINKALREAHRVLKKNGTLVISVPFFSNEGKTIKRSILENGKIKYLLPPVYHENTISKKKDSLVFYDYAWDLLDFIKDAGFSDAYMLGYYSMFFGYIGDGLQFIFIAKKQ